MADALPRQIYKKTHVLLAGKLDVQLVTTPTAIHVARLLLSLLAFHAGDQSQNWHVVQDQPGEVVG